VNSHRFSLKPFPSSDTLPYLEISGNIGRLSKTLTISYTLHGLLSEVIIPAPADVPARKNALWEETCFEFFLGAKKSDRYWEFNLSPAEHWNVYCFKSYRQGMQEELAFESLPVSVRRKPDVLQLSLKLDLDKINLIDQTLEVAISAVISHVNGKITYWALTHPGRQADFHRKDSFIIEL